MANDNNNNNQDNNNSNNNNNNNDNSPLQPRRNLLLEAFYSIRTPLQNRSRIDWQELIDWQHHQQQDILNFDANIGLTTTLFDEKEKEEEEEKEEVERAENPKKKKNQLWQLQLTKLEVLKSRLTMPLQSKHTDYNVGFMISKEYHPGYDFVLT